MNIPGILESYQSKLTPPLRRRLIALERSSYESKEGDRKVEPTTGSLSNKTMDDDLLMMSCDTKALMDSENEEDDANSYMIYKPMGNSTSKYINKSTISTRNVQIANCSNREVRVDDKFLDDEDDSSLENIKIQAEETFWSITIQVFIPFLIAGVGMVGAGLVLDVVQHWPVFVKVPEVFILVPALLGLKGNLEMTLASRLSTQANLGNLDSPKARWNIALGNLSLVQCQAIVIGFLASVAAVTLGWIPEGQFNINHALVLCTSSVVTASLASFCLGVVMVLVVLMSKYFRINPDNVATPIAASLGDLTTLSLLAFISNAIYSVIELHTWVASVILGAYLISMPFWIIIAKGNSSTKKILYTGWTPVLCAMVISSMGGLILDYTVKHFTGIAVFQPVLSGVGGNLVAVQASRISTSLHSESQLGTLPPSIPRLCSNPVSVFFAKGGHAMTARVLILMVVPGHLIFAYTISFVQAGHTSITLVFLFFYLMAALIQVILLLYIAEVLIQFLWLRKVDPDNSAIPYLTSLGDLFGTGLLALAFLFLYWIGDRDSDVGD